MFGNRLRAWAAGRGYALAIVATGVVGTVRKKLEKRRDDGLIDPGIVHDYLDGFRYLEGSPITGPKCLVVVAVPSPIHVLPFVKDGKRTEGLLPPTYVRYNRTFTDVLADMKDNALGTAVQAEILRAPLKSLAVHAGLALYGRNNITYVPGLGSGHQLCGYVVGMEKRPRSEKDGADPPEAMLERCADCRACLKACPTGAIREDRFVISAERCFTYISESRKPFPAWARPPRSLCLIGCMNCQQGCPENKGMLKKVPSGVEFTAEEAEAVIEVGRCLTASGPDEEGISKARGNPAYASARDKFGELGMSEDLDIVGRNLGYLLQIRGHNTHSPISREPSIMK